MARAVKRETQLVVAPERFIPVCTATAAWYKRKQCPAANGTCDLLIHGYATLTIEEAKLARMNPEEYAEAGWVPLTDVAKKRARHVPLLPRTHCQCDPRRACTR